MAKLLTDKEIRDAIELLEKNDVKSTLGVISHDGKKWVKTNFFVALITRIKWFFKIYK